MHNAETLATAPALYLSLALLPDPARALAFAQFIGAEEATVRAGLGRLEQAGLAVSESSGGLWRVSGEAARQKLGAAAGAVGLKSEGQLENGLALLWSGHTLKGTRSLIHVLRDLIYAGNTPGALVCLDILLYALEKWGHTPNRSLEENERYIYLSRMILGVALYLTKRRARARALGNLLSRLAEDMGDRRSILRQKMMQVCLHHSIGSVLDEDPGSAMDKVLEEARELGDADILSSATHGRGMQHYIHGEFAETIENYRYFRGGLSKDDRFYGGIAVNIVALSACSLGRFGNALGAVQMALRSAAGRGMQYALKSAKTLGGDVLLRAGRPDEALELMGEGEFCCDAESESRLAMWRVRNLAFYHFQKRNNARAHLLLTECAALAARYNIHRPLLWLPDTFEMLWVFQEAGFPEIPGHQLEDFLDSAMSGPNMHEQGLALRIRARQLIKNGHFQASLPLLEASLERFRQCRAPLGLARSQIVLAESLAGLGRLEEARKLRLTGCATLDEHHQYDRYWYCAPGELKKQRPARSEGLERARLCREALAGAAGAQGEATHLQSVLDRLRDELRLERVAVFSVAHDYELICLAARDFIAEERSRKLPDMYGKRMLDCVREGRVLRWRSRYGAVLCLPLRVSAQQNCVFFAHCAYLSESIMEPDDEYFGPIISFLEGEVRTELLVSQSVQAAQLREENRSRLAAERADSGSELYYGPAMQKILELADKAAPTAAPLLVLGETGAGKEELARRVHRKSGRSGPFVVVHPASIPEQLFESELFGHEKGSFTGAYQQKIGLLEVADKGTLFIDEIGEISLGMQVKLLRVLQDKKFLRVGGTSLLSSDFRLISATHQNLVDKIREGSFREDFYYRIAVMPLVMPSLRERPEDIKHLARMFYAHFSAKYKKSLPPLTPDELRQLCALPWPGNVRELRSFVERGVILYDPSKGGFIQERMSGAELAPGPLTGQGLSQISSQIGGQIGGPMGQAMGMTGGLPRPGVEVAGSAATGRSDGTFGPGEAGEAAFCCNDLPTLEELQRRYLEHVLRLTHGKVGGADGAQGILDVKLSTLYKKMKKYGLDKTSLIYGRR